MNAGLSSAVEEMRTSEFVSFDPIVVTVISHYHPIVMHE